MTSHNVWPVSSYCHHFRFRDRRKWRKFHCFCYNFFYFYYLLLSWAIFTLYPSPVLLQVLTQQALILMHCALETSMNNIKWFWFHVDSFACIHLTLERNGLRRFVQHRIKSGRPKRTEIIKFQETAIRFYY